jgi:hypothetical protein
MIDSYQLYGNVHPGHDDDHTVAWRLGMLEHSPNWDSCENPIGEWPIGGDTIEVSAAWYW